MTTTRKAEYQKWSEEDFQADIDVRLTLDWLQRLLYKQLLNSAWVYSTRPDLPNDDEQLWKLAGCPKEVWEQNKGPIKAMFEEEDDLLFRKRLREEWGFLSNVREAATNGGLAGAAARWGIPKPRNPQKDIPRLCSEIFGKAELGNWWKQEIKNLTGIYGGTAVVEGFESWARSFNGETDKPISYFCKAAGQYIGTGTHQDNPELDKLARTLYDIGGQPFSGNKRSGLATLLESYTCKEIEIAYKEFITTRDEYSIKFAPHEFTQGAGKDIIEAAKFRKNKAENEQRLMELKSMEERRNVEQQLRELESEEIEEHL